MTPPARRNSATVAALIPCARAAGAGIAARSAARRSSQARRFARILIRATSYPRARVAALQSLEQCRRRRNAATVSPTLSPNLARQFLHSRSLLRRVRTVAAVEHLRPQCWRVSKAATASPGRRVSRSPQPPQRRRRRAGVAGPRGEGFRAIRVARFAWRRRGMCWRLKVLSRSPKHERREPKLNPLPGPYQLREPAPQRGPSPNIGEAGARRRAERLRTRERVPTV